MRTLNLKGGGTLQMLDLVEDKIRYRIEHETRGIYVGFWHNSKDEYVPRFRHSILRTDANAWFADSADRAVQEMERVTRHVPKAYLVRMLRSTG